jgi:predicted nuclease of predicted toxin-antitoxin system
MRFLADENFPRAAVKALEAGGHDVLWIKAVDPGAADTDVLARAVADGRILLTFDKDFGELAASSVPAPACGIVLLRIPVPKSEGAGQRLARLIQARSDWVRHFSVIEPGRIRMRRLG